MDLGPYPAVFAQDCEASTGLASLYVHHGISCMMTIRTASALAYTLIATGKATTNASSFANSTRLQYSASQVTLLDGANNLLSDSGTLELGGIPSELVGHFSIASAGVFERRQTIDLYNQTGTGPMPTLELGFIEQ